MAVCVPTPGQPVAKIIGRDLGALGVVADKWKRVLHAFGPAVGRPCGQPAGKYAGRDERAMGLGRQVGLVSRGRQSGGFLVGHADRRSPAPRRRRAGVEVFHWRAMTVVRLRSSPRARNRSISVSTAIARCSELRLAGRILHLALSDAVVALPFTAQWRFAAGGIDPDRLRGLRRSPARAIRALAVAMIWAVDR